MLDQQKGWYARGEYGLVLIIALAIIPRIIDIGNHIANDSTTWLMRSFEYVNAIKDGRYQDTYRAPHPGVTVMAASGTAAGAYLYMEARERGIDLQTARDQMSYATFIREFPKVYTYASIPIALISAISIGLMYLLLVRCVGQRAALAAGIIMCLDAFAVAHSRILHIDGTFAVLQIISILALLTYLQTYKLKYMVVSGVAAGLALLTRSAALFIVPFACLSICVSWSIKGRMRDSQTLHIKRDTVALITLIVIMGVVVVMLFPAMWFSPAEITGRIIGAGAETVTANTDSHDEFYHDRSYYFRGQVLSDVGMLFYPYVLLYRSMPGICILSGVFVIVGTVAFVKRRAISTLYYGLPLYVLLYTGMLCLSKFKQDRYLLPVLLACDIMAGIALVSSIKYIQGRIRWSGRTLWLAPVVTVAVVYGAILVDIHPSYMAYYNKLWYTNDSAQETFESGFGEGLKEAADYLNQFPKAEQMVVASSTDRSFAPFFRGRTVSLDEYGEQPVDCVIISQRYLQRNKVPAVLQRVCEEQEPEHVIYLNGLRYHTIYRTSYGQKSEIITIQ